MKSEKEYSSAVVYFINRENQKVVKSMMYPIIKVELNEFEGTKVKKVKSFVVKDGSWVLE